VEQKSKSKYAHLFQKKTPQSESTDKELRAFYLDTWTELVTFRLCDAAKPEERYVDDNNNDFTHIYSYNKVMSEKDLIGISNILNRTNWRILGWYFSPDATAKCGLKNYKLLTRMSMHTTGNERYSCFIYYNTKQVSKPK
jgi:hypothetical protein